MSTPVTPNGGALGAGDRCPMCGAASGVAPDHDGYVCLVCGAPRVLVTAALERPRRERPLLEEANAQRLRRAAWGVIASLSMAFGGAVLAIGALGSFFFHFGPFAVAAYGSLVLTLLFVSAIGYWRSRRASRNARAALEAAQVIVTEELAEARGQRLDADELASLLRVPLARAEELLATAQIDRMLEGGDRLRVEDGADQRPADLNPVETKSRDKASRN